MLLLIFTGLGNIILAITKFIFAATLPSLWFFINACFLAILSLSRFFSIRNYGRIKNTKDQSKQRKLGYKSYLHNGILLILLGLMYFFVSVYIYYKGTTTTMHEYLTYLVALNAFWQIGWSIHGMIKYPSKTNPILKSVKITNFANALTSIALTQVVLLDTFGEPQNYSNLNGYTGIFVSLIIITLGTYMIINSQDLKSTI